MTSFWREQDGIETTWSSVQIWKLQIEIELGHLRIWNPNCNPKQQFGTFWQCYLNAPFPIVGLSLQLCFISSSIWFPNVFKSSMTRRNPFFPNPALKRKTETPNEKMVAFHATTNSSLPYFHSVWVQGTQSHRSFDPSIFSEVGYKTLHAVIKVQ